ncbi:MAG: DUF424 domain-containing protein [Haloferacaceae archaeon]
MTLLLRERETPEGLLVSVCDGDCLGETYEGEDGVSLEVKEEFYGGEAAVEADPDAVVDSLHRATTANIVGDRAVDVAVDAGLVDGDRVLELDGTRHAQLLWLR